MIFHGFNYFFGWGWNARFPQATQVRAPDDTRHSVRWRISRRSGLANEVVENIVTWLLFFLFCFVFAILNPSPLPHWCDWREKGFGAGLEGQLGVVSGSGSQPTVGHSSQVKTLVWLGRRHATRRARWVGLWTLCTIPCGASSHCFIFPYLYLIHAENFSFHLN